VLLTRSGADMTQFLFTRKGNQLRIENADKSKPEPVNVVDLAANKLTIIYPHNSSFVVVDLTKRETQTGGPNLPPGFPTPPNMNASQSEAATDSAQTRPAISPPPGFPTPPPRPSMPPMPNNPMAAGMPNMPAGVPPMPNNPMASGAPSMPMMPPMPVMGGLGGTPELKKTDKTKKIQGFDCTLYTISDRMETFEIWATSDSALFPFRLIQTNYLNRHFGPRMLEEQWVELLQKQKLFPLEAILRNDLHIQRENQPGSTPPGNAGAAPEQGSERFSFKVDKIEKKKITDDALFKPPEKYYEILVPNV
jgi:hypothetical protein